MSNMKNLLSLRWWLGAPDRSITKKPEKNYGITVIIPAYNEEKSIGETIRCVQAQTVPIDKILVIDDCSSDRTGEIASSMGATVVRTDKNQGTKSSAQQYVLDRGMIKTELFITIDGDTMLAADAIEKALPCFNDPMAGAACGYVIPARVKSLWERGRLVEYLFSISLYKAAQNHMGAVMVASGCFTIFRTELVEKFGGFNERTMAEDMDLTWELSSNGYRIYCIKKALCYPYDPPTRKIFVAQLDRWYRGYFQNLAFHWKGIVKRDKKLATFAFGYLLDASLLLILSLWAMIVSFQSSSFFAIIVAAMVDLSVVSVFTLIEGARLGRFWQVFFSLPAYYVIRPINAFVFWRSMWKEWIVKDKLKVWVKGH